MENKELQEKVLDILTSVMEITEHSRKHDYWNDGTHSHSYTDSTIWYKGSYDLYQKIEKARSQVMLGELELSLYTLSDEIETIVKSVVPNILDVDIDVIILVKQLINKLKALYEDTSIADAQKYQSMFNALDIEITPKQMGGFYSQLSGMISDLTKSSTSEYGYLKMYHCYGTDEVPISATFQTPLTIISGYYPEVWLNALIQDQKSKTEYDNSIHINLYNVKDVFDPSYEYFLIAVTYRSTLFIVSDEIKHPNIWARFQCRSRNNRRVEDRFENISLPYDAVANFEVTRKNESTALSNVRTFEFDEHNLDTSEANEKLVISKSLDKLKEMGYTDLSTSQLSSRGNYSTIITYFNTNMDTVAIGYITNGFFDNEKKITVTIFDKLIISNSIDIMSLEPFEKMFFIVFGLGLRSILSAKYGDYTGMMRGEFGDQTLALTSGTKSEEETTFDWNKDFDADKSWIDTEKRGKYVNRMLKHAKQIEESGLLSGTEVALIDEVYGKQLDHTNSTRTLKDTSRYNALFPVIGKSGISVSQQQWLSLESERERAQRIFDKLEEHIFSNKFTEKSSWSDRRSASYNIIGKHIHKHKDQLLKYAFGIINSGENENGRKSPFKTREHNGYYKIVKHIEHANQNKEDEFSTWRNQYNLNADPNYMESKSNNQIRRFGEYNSIFDPTFEEYETFKYCRVIVQFTSAEHICEALGHTSTDELPLIWRSFLLKEFQPGHGNTNLDNVNPMSLITTPRVFTEALNIGIIMSKKEYKQLLKSGGVYEVVENKFD